MRNDKEFKLKNRDESYVKDKRPDIQLGRHTEGEKQKPPITPSKKNRMYRARQTENTVANSENVSVETKIDISVSKTADNNAPVPADSTAQIPDRDIEPDPKRKIYHRIFSRIFRKPSLSIPLPQGKRNTAVKCTVCKNRRKALITILQSKRKNPTTTIFPKSTGKQNGIFKKYGYGFFGKQSRKGQ